MQRPSLEGRSILIVEDEPLILLDIAQIFATTGASLTTTTTLRHALMLAEEDGLSAAILDNALGHEDCAKLCSRLRERGVPFLIYSGMPAPMFGPCAGVPYISKPACEGALISAMDKILASA